MSTDQEWEKWGQHDPFYAVISSDDFRGAQNQERFFASGEHYFDNLRKRFETIGLPLQSGNTAVDYGCGVGRVLRPMAGYFRHTVGFDVSAAMLQKAAESVSELPVDLIRVTNDDVVGALATRAPGFIHSTLVLQHIPSRRGLLILEQLMGALAADGRALIQMPIDRRRPIRHRISQIYKRIPAIARIIRTLGKRPNRTEPIMMMEVYRLPDVMNVFERLGIEIRGLDWMPDNDVWSAAFYLHKAR